MDKKETTELLVELEVHLKSCPFCGNERIELRSVPHGYNAVERDYYGFCIACACQGPWSKSRTMAIRMWNRELLR